jgi:hypothetical protein
MRAASGSWRCLGTRLRVALQQAAILVQRGSVGLRPRRERRGRLVEALVPDDAAHGREVAVSAGVGVRGRHEHAARGMIEQRGHHRRASAQIFGAVLHGAGHLGKPVARPRDRGLQQLGDRVGIEGRLGDQWRGVALVLSFLFFYKLGDSLCTALATPFYLDMGFSRTDIGIIAKNAGLWASVVGGMLGGLWMVKIGINRGLWLFGAVQLFSILGFALLARASIGGKARSAKGAPMSPAFDLLITGAHLATMTGSCACRTISMPSGRSRKPGWRRCR